MLAGFVNLHDVGMMQAGDGLCLGPEPAEPHLAGVGSSQDHLERDQSIQPAVPRLVNDPHAAPTEFREHVVPWHGHAEER